MKLFHPPAGRNEREGERDGKEGGKESGEPQPVAGVIQVEDNGEPGTTDKFSIQLESGYQNSGVLLGGNIQIH